MASPAMKAWDRAKYISVISGLIDKHWHTLGGNAWTMFLNDVLCDLVPRYRHDRAISEKERQALREITSLYGEAVAVCPPFSDLLGPIYMDLSSRGHRSSLGQFFTPESICDLMAQITAHDLIPKLKTMARPLTIQEPAAGSGAMLLALLRMVADEDPALLEKLDITAIDLDITCVKMTSIQVLATMMVHNLRLSAFAVYRGDALGDPDNLDCFVYARRKKAEPCAETDGEPAPAALPTTEAVQQCLF